MRRKDSGSTLLSWSAAVLLGAGLAAGVALPWGGEHFSASALLSYVVHLVRRSYVHPVDPRKLSEKLLAGLPEALDDWSTYITPDRFPDFDEEAEGRFGGIGVVFQLKEDRYIVRLVLPGGPADKAGVKEGWELVAAEGIPLRGKPQREVRRLLRGAAGTPVHLVVRDNEGRDHEVTVVRRELTEPSVHRVGFVRGAAGIGYVRVEQFQRDTTHQLDQALEALRRAGLKALIVDMRENPGGLYSQAVKVADRFLENGVIVRIRGRSQEGSGRVTARAGDEYKVGPVAVLVNRRTASAAELVAAALRDNRRAILVGEPTFGKWSVQTVFEIFGKPEVWGALKITTKRYYSPEEETYGGRGLPVDLKVKIEEKQEEKLLALWQEDLWRNWAAPTALRAEPIPQEGDPVLAEAASVLSSPQRYEELLKQRRQTSEEAAHRAEN